MSALLPDVVVDAVVVNEAPVALGIVAAVTSVVFLATSVLGDASEAPKAKALGRHLIVSIVPLLLVFALTVLWNIFKAPTDLGTGVPGTPT